jgi:hypothetical protein
VIYNLKSTETEIQAAFAFVNGTFYHFGLFIVKGSPLYSHAPPENILDKADDTLEKFYSFSKSFNDMKETRDFDRMRNTLNTISKVDDQESRLDNIKLTATTERNITALKWMPIIDNVTFPGITMEFQKGTLVGIGDNWRIYKIGSVDINISEEEAINIAKRHLDNFSWSARIANGDLTEVTNFEVVDEPLSIKLVTTRSREPLTIYPCWHMELYLDKEYPGHVNRISLAIWADTGEIISCIPLSTGGAFTENQMEKLASQTENNNSLILNTTIVAAVVIGLGITVLAIKKKRQ